MKVNKTQNNGNLIIELLEDITFENSQELENIVFSSVDGDTKKVILNVGKSKYVNSFALGVLIKTMQDVEKKGYEFYLTQAHADFMKLLKITGLLDKFKFYNK